MTLTCDALSKTYRTESGPVHALSEVTFVADEHEFLCVVGPSGCGKTTLLKIIAGLVEPSSGTVHVGDAGSDGEPRSALVFQEHGLLPWLTVLDNVAFGLEAEGVPRAERHEIAHSFIRRVGLAGFTDKYPGQLSGGMQQRVGIARAMAIGPELLLMDEPFGSLDAQTKLVMQEDLLRVWREDRQQVIYVTHDLDEAVRLGDRVLVLGGHPGTVLDDIGIPISRPRDLSADSSREASDLRWRIWKLLEDEVRAGLSEASTPPHEP